MKLIDGSYRCDVCGQPREPRYVRGWILDDEGCEREVEPQCAEEKHVCVVCEVRGVFLLGMPALAPANSSVNTGDSTKPPAALATRGRTRPPVP